MKTIKGVGTLQVVPKYVMERVVVNKTTIKEFYIYEDERRKIRTGKVNSICKSFDNKDKNEQHFDSPLVVNVMNGKKNVVDGNHRIDAIELKLSTSPDFSIVVWIAKYNGLSRDEERMVYTKWNSGTPESSTDFLKWHWKTIPLGEQMLKELPATIYGNETKFQMKLLVGSHINAKKQNNFEGGYGVNGQKTVSDFKQIVSSDIRTIKDFCSYMDEIFQPFHNKSPFYRSTPFNAFYRIWYDNRLDMNREKFIEIWKNVFLLRWYGVFDIMSRSGGRVASQTFYNKALEELNAHRKKFQWKKQLALSSPETL